MLCKRAVLRPDEVAPLAPDGSAAAMHEPNLVVAGEASAAERALAEQALADVAARFGRFPLYARVDLLTGTGGEPLLIELEVAEPALYLAAAPGAAERFAAAIRAS